MFLFPYHSAHTRVIGPVDVYNQKDTIKVQNISKNPILIQRYLVSSNEKFLVAERNLQPNEIYTYDNLMQRRQYIIDNNGYTLKVKAYYHTHHVVYYGLHKGKNRKLIRRFQ
jgi:hypothetical protein